MLVTDTLKLAILKANQGAISRRVGQRIGNINMKCFQVPTSRSSVPGYVETRRQILVGASTALAACIASPNQLLAALQDSDYDDSLERFIDGTSRQATELKLNATQSGQDQYVNYLAGAVSEVDNAPVDNLSESSWKNLDPGVFLGVSGRNMAFFVVHWQLEPGAFLPPHCHPKTSVCTLGLRGDATLRHFEAEAGAPSYRDDRDSEFLIKETRRIELTAGTTSTLTEYRDNIHLFVAGKQGARGIDVTTDYGGDGSFSFLEFDHNKPARSPDSYLARWIGTSL